MLEGASKGLEARMPCWNVSKDFGTEKLPTGGADIGSTRGIATGGERCFGLVAKI